MSDPPILSELIDKATRRINIQRLIADFIDGGLIAAAAVLVGLLVGKALEKSIGLPFVSAGIFLLALVFALLLNRLRSAIRQDSQQQACDLLDKELAAKDRITSLHSLDTIEEKKREFQAIRNLIDRQVGSALASKQVTVSVLVPLRLSRPLLLRLLAIITLFSLSILLTITPANVLPITSTTDIALEQEELIANIDKLIETRAAVPEIVSQNLAHLKREIINNGLGSIKVDQVLNNLESTIAKASSTQSSSLATSGSTRLQAPPQETLPPKDNSSSDSIRLQQDRPEDVSNTTEANKDSLSNADFNNNSSKEQPPSSGLGKSPERQEDSVSTSKAASETKTPSKGDEQKQSEKEPGDSQNGSKDADRSTAKSANNNRKEGSSSTSSTDKHPERGQSDNGSNSSKNTTASTKQDASDKGAETSQARPKESAKDEGGAQATPSNQGSTPRGSENNSESATSGSSSPDKAKTQHTSPTRAKEQAAKARQLITAAEQLEENNAANKGAGTQQATNKDNPHDQAGVHPPEATDQPDRSRENVTKSTPENRSKENRRPEASQEQKSQEKGGDKQKGDGINKQSESREAQVPKAPGQPNESEQEGQDEVQPKDGLKNPPNPNQYRNSAEKSQDQATTSGNAEGQEPAPIRGDEEQASRFGEGADGDGGEGNQGIGFSNQELTTQPEQVDTRFTGSQTTSVEHNESVRSKLGINKFDIKKPEITGWELQQPIPLEYKDKLK